MSQRPFTALRLVGSVAWGIAEELRGLAQSRTLLAPEAQQCEAVATLATALLEGRKTPGLETAAFGSAFLSFAALFEAADIASRQGGLNVPASAPKHPWPMTPIFLAWLGVAVLVDCLTVIVNRAEASDRRREQLEVLAKLKAVLRDLGGDPTNAAALAEVEALFLSAGAIVNGEETDAIVAAARAALLSGAPAGTA